MKAEDQYMDEQFRKAAADQKFGYDSSFWNEMESQLADDQMDQAFRQSAEGAFAPMASFDFGAAMEDAFMDDAFKSATSKAEANYQGSYWSQFLKERSALEQDISFNDAANALRVDYQSTYWTDADIALQREGLHYEYKSSYWDDARALLDKADRRIFFMRWSAVAALLVLLSMGGIYQVSQPEVLTADGSGKQNGMLRHNQPLEKLDAIAFSEVNENSDQTIGSAEITETSQDGSVNSNNTFENHSPQGIENRDLAMQNDTPPNSSEVNPEFTETHLAVTPNAETGDTNHDLQNDPNADRQPEDGAITESVSVNHSQDLRVDNLAMVGLGKNILERDIISDMSIPQLEIESFELKPTHSFSFIFQAGYGNKYGVAEFTPTYRTALGVEYKRTGFGRMRDFEFGASLSMNHVRQNDFGTERRVSVFNIDGGIDNLWYKLQLKDMIYSNLSFLTSYRIDPKQNLRLNVGVDYLTFVQSNMAYKASADEEVKTVNNNWGVKEGLNKFDIRLGIGYEYNFNSRLALQLNGSYGFFDRSDNSFINDNMFDHEMNATVGLKYTFIRKP